jgi:hypothetical protein
MAKKRELTPPIDQDLKKYVGALCKQIAECVKRDDFTLARRQVNDLFVELAELEAQKRVAKQNTGATEERRDSSPTAVER